MTKWACILGVNFPQKSKTFFPKNGFSPNSNFLPILFPSPCNNYFNQFLAVINDWLNETRKVVDCLMGSPLEIWIFPIVPKGLNIPPLILRKACPHLIICCIDIAGCGFLIKLHIYMMFKIIMCQLEKNTIGNEFSHWNIKMIIHCGPFCCSFTP